MKDSLKYIILIIISFSMLACGEMEPPVNKKDSENLNKPEDDLIIYNQTIEHNQNRINELYSFIKHYPMSDENLKKLDLIYLAPILRAQIMEDEFFDKMTLLFLLKLHNRGLEKDQIGINIYSYRPKNYCVAIFVNRFLSISKLINAELFTCVAYNWAKGQPIYNNDPHIKIELEKAKRIISRKNYSSNNCNVDLRTFQAM